MHRHFIVGVLSCFGSSLFAQSTITPPLTQPQGALSNIQNTLQGGTQSPQGTAQGNVQQSAGATAAGTTATGGTTASGTTASGTTASGNGPNRSSLNAQGQVITGQGLNGSTGVQGNTNLQNNSNGQSGQVNSNLSTQLQGSAASGTQQPGAAQPSPYNQQGNTLQANGSNVSQGMQRQTQPGQSQIAGPVYVLRVDVTGREFICVNGMPIYFDKLNSLSLQGNSSGQNQYRAGYGSYDGKNGENVNGGLPKTDQQKNQPPMPATGLNPSGSDAKPNSEATVGSTQKLNVDQDARSTSKENQNAVEAKPNVDNTLDAPKQIDPSINRTQPKL